MQTIGLTVNREKKAAVRLADMLTRWLKDHGKTCCTIEDTIPDVVEGIICIGGDGSLLHVARLLNGKRIPVIGVNAGSLGFLTSVKEDEVYTELELIFSGNYLIEERRLLAVTIEQGVSQETAQVLNDVVIGREGLTRFMTVRVTVNGAALPAFGGDGVVVATPTGSTAYSLSAGGPVMYPTMSAIIITPLNAHGLRPKPIIVPADAQVVISITCEYDKDQACVVLDGQEKRTLGRGGVVQITQSSRTFLLVTSTRRSYFDVLYNKL